MSTTTEAAPLYTTGDHGTTAVQWSTYRDWRYPDTASPLMTVSEAIAASPHREAFLAVVASFAAKASRHERVEVRWWGNPLIYVGVTDGRRAYPVSMRALISFDPANGRWASYRSKGRYVFARRGWHSFITRLACVNVPLYGE